MIDPNSPDYEAWYQANLVCARQCAAWRKEIASQRATRALIDGAQRVALLSHSKLQGYTTKAELVALFADRGPQMRRFARAATRDELAERVIQDRLDTIDIEIARLEKQIRENQPSPLWRERKEEDA